jgi:UDP-glucose 4-epimerase
MKVLVTGGSGFIGRNVAEHLREQHEVLAPTHAELELTDAEAVRTWLRGHPVDAVIHGAVRPGHRNAADPSGQLWTNLRMLFNLTRNQDCFGKLVFLGSGAAYDTRRSLARVAESAFDTSVPVDEHGLSKYVIAKYLQELVAGGRLDAVELRLFGVYGKYEDYSIRFISNAVCKTLSGLPITLRQNRRFSYLFIDDLMPVLDWSLGNRLQHVVYNVVPPWTDDLYDLAATISTRSPEDLPIRVTHEGFGLEYSADGSRLHAEMPGITAVESAIDRLFAWYAQQGDLLDRDLLSVDK